jgi:serine/threonine protein kinase
MGYSKGDAQVNSSKDLIPTGRATVGSTKKIVVPTLHLQGIERSFEGVAVVKEQPESEGSHDQNIERTRHKSNLCSVDVDISTHNPMCSPTGKTNASINQAIYLNSHHVQANGKIGAQPTYPKYEQRSMIFPHRQDPKGIFMKKKSEKSIPTKFGVYLREGRSQARVTPSHQKVSLPQISGRGEPSRITLPQNDAEMCDRIDIEVINDNAKKEDVRTFIKHGLSSRKGDREHSEPLFTQIRKPSLNDFIIHSIIGKGSFGEVYLVQKKGTKKFYAMKTLPKKRIIKENLTRYALTERNVLSTISHPFIVKLRYAFQNTKTLFLIMDYLPGGDLGRYLQDEGQISETKARIYAAEITLAISELHQRDIIFRDLKPENVLLDKDGHAMLSDFGLSKENVLLENQERSFCGSVAYLAPEMLKKTGHGKAMDWYLVGVIIYEMVVGIPPFFAETKEELFRNIEHATVRFPGALSAQLKDLLSKLFEKDPHKRIREDEIKAHPWFKDICWEAAMYWKLRPPKPHIKRMKMNQLGDIIPDVESENFGVENLKGWTFIEEINEGEAGMH